MNSFELAGLFLKVAAATEKPNEQNMAFLGNGNLDYEELDR